jgi:hypothetical protein
VYGHCVFMLRKGSPYMGIINFIVRKVRDTGLVLYWEDLTVRKYMSTRRQLSVINSRKEADPGPTQLLLRHVMVSTEKPHLLLLTRIVTVSASRANTSCNLFSVFSYSKSVYISCFW